MAKPWDDLSDDELGARLLQRGALPAQVDMALDDRESGRWDPFFAAYLGDER